MTTVYQATNLVNGKRYIGVTARRLDQRIWLHRSATRRGSTSPFHCALRKYGIDLFRFSVLLVCADTDADAKEIRLIASLKPEYNVALGGRLGPSIKIYTPEVRAKMAAKAAARFHNYADYMAMGPRVSARPVMCWEDGLIYDSASAAARAYEIPKSQIIETCLCKPFRFTARGRHFAYLAGDG
jgi:hypothetical protein